MKEADFMRRCQKRATDLGSRLFRNNVGTGWQGKTERRADGSMLIREPRPLHSGLAAGSSDLIGFVPVTITPDMVGQQIAVFASAEIKTAKGRATEEQKWWIDMVRGFGGIAGIVRTDEDLQELLTSKGLRKDDL